MKASEIAKFLSSELVGEDFEIKGICTLRNPKEDCLAFWNGVGTLYLSTERILLLCSKNLNFISYIQVDNPRLAHAKVVNEFYNSWSLNECVNVTYGKNCKVHPSSIIGKGGFGPEFEDGIPMLRPHIGGVRIGDSVEIGALCVVQRGTIDDTIIEDNVKIDDQCHIGHNVIIKENTIITSGVVICGTTTIGKNCWIGVNSNIMQHITIGDNVIIGIGANIVNDVPSNTVMAGMMAQPIDSMKRVASWVISGGTL